MVYGKHGFTVFLGMATLHMPFPAMMSLLVCWKQKLNVIWKWIGYITFTASKGFGFLVHSNFYSSENWTKYLGFINIAQFGPY